MTFHLIHAFIRVTNTRRVALPLIGCFIMGLGATRPALALDVKTISQATNSTLLSSSAASLVPVQKVVNGVDTFTLAGANIAMGRSAVSSGPGWVREKIAGVAGHLEFTDAAEYFFVTDFAGIDQVPLDQVVSAEFAAFVKDKMRKSAQQTANPAERVYILQKSALQAIEPLWLDRDKIALDPYAALDVTVCVPMPVVGGITRPNFSLGTVIREITPGILEYQELTGVNAATDLGRLLGAVNMKAFRTPLPATGSTSGAPQGAVAQSASAGGMSCFNLLDVLRSDDAPSCKVDPLDPSSWYKEHEATGRIELTPPDASLDISVDTSSGADQVLSGIYEGKLRLDTDVRFKDQQGRGIGGSMKVEVGQFLCVPIWLRPVQGRLWAHLDASRELEMHGTIKYDGTQTTNLSTQGRTGMSTIQAPTNFDSQLPDPAELAFVPGQAPLFMYPIAFMVGPVPVLLILDAPIEVGISYGVQSPTLTNFAIKGGIRAGFDYACRFGGNCEAKEAAYFEPWAEAGVSGDVGLEGRAFVKPYLGLSFRASLYSPGAIYAKVGPRAYLNLDLWGASKSCGDADGNGTAEYIQALALDTDAGVELIGEIGIYDPPTTGSALLDGLIPDSYSFPIGQPLNWHLNLVNLKSPDGKGFQPMLAAPASIQEDVTATFGAKMRPCYPYTDDVTYQIRDGNGQGASMKGAPQQSVSATTVYPNPGAYTATLEAVSDAHGRKFGDAIGTPLVTSVTRQVAVKSAPVTAPKITKSIATSTVRR